MRAGGADPERRRRRARARRLAATAVELRRAVRRATRPKRGPTSPPTARPGGQGVTVAVLDTGVAYANRGPFRRSPDFSRYTFVQGYDFVANDPYPNDRNGHGTFVAATIAEATDNRFGLTGLAYGARIMPVRVLDSQGEGEASTIAEGVRFAVNHHAQVINLSLEFSPRRHRRRHPRADRSAALCAPPQRARGRRRGQRGTHRDRLPRARARRGLGRRDDRTRLPGRLLQRRRRASRSWPRAAAPTPTFRATPTAIPKQPSGRDIYQVTFTGSSAARFGLPSGYEGTSMATPHVAATAALIIASGVLGPHPTPAQLTARLRATATQAGRRRRRTPLRGRARERRRGHRARRPGPCRLSAERAVAEHRFERHCLSYSRTEPPQSRGATRRTRCDLAIVGGGIVGLAVGARADPRATRARRSACSSASPSSATHQTGHNSGVIHAGVYYVPGSLKARLCVEGAREMYEYCEQRGIASERCGKVIVATDAVASSPASRSSSAAAGPTACPACAGSTPPASRSSSRTRAGSRRCTRRTPASSTSPPSRAPTPQDVRDAGGDASPRAARSRA